jgi:PqqD family protein of HPr-rel-A system
VHAATTWHLAPGQTLRHRVWDDEAVVYNDLTGDTHRLDAAALEVLLALQAGPHTLPTLCQALEIDAPGDDIFAEIGDTLSALARIALVESAAC